MRELLRDSRYRMLLAGQSTSMAGDSIMLLALAIWVKDLTGSSGMAGAVMLAIAAPALLSPLLGWAVDRVRRRPFLIWTNVASGGALLPLLTVRSRGDIWVIYLVAVGYGVSFLLNSAGLAGLLKLIVEDERLADANASLRTVREGLRLVGPVAGAGLYATAGAPAVVALDLATFLAAAAALTAIRVPEPVPQRTERHWLTEATAGFGHLFGQSALRRCALALAAALLVFGTMESGVFAYVDAGLHRPATFVGVLVTVMGIGSIVGGVLTPRLVRRIGEPGTVALGLATLACGLGPLVYPRVGLGVAAMPMAGVGVSLTLVAFVTVLQRCTPPPLMARVSTATDLLVGTPQTVSIATGAILVSGVDFRWMFATAAAGLTSIAGVLWKLRNPPSEVAPEGQPWSPIAEPVPAPAS